MTDGLEELLKNNTAASDDKLQDMLSHFKPLTARKGEMLLEKGSVADRLFFIAKGCLRLYYTADDYTTYTRFMAFENTFLTSMVSFISQEPAPEYIQAVESSQLLYITYQDLFQLRGKCSEWQKLYIYVLEYGLTVITSRLSGLLTQSATERYKSLLQNNPELVQRLSNSNLAAYLNVSPETLSRIKSHI